MTYNVERMQSSPWLGSGKSTLYVIFYFEGGQRQGDFYIHYERKCGGKIFSKNFSKLGCVLPRFFSCFNEGVEKLTWNFGQEEPGMIQNRRPCIFLLGK